MYVTCARIVPPEVFSTAPVMRLRKLYVYVQTSPVDVWVDRDHVAVGVVGVVEHVQRRAAGGLTQVSPVSSLSALYE